MTINFAVLGDSIAYGQGADRAQDTIGARLAAALDADGSPVALRVFAVPGAVSAGLVEQTRSALAWGARLAVIIVGANDLTRLVPPRQAAEQLGEAIRALLGSGAQVVAVPAPDMSVVPWVPPQFRAIVRARSVALRRAQSDTALALGARVADAEGATAGAFSADQSLFCADRFHPSSAGYALITQALGPAVKAAARALTASRDGIRADG